MNGTLGIKIAGSLVLVFLTGCNPMNTGSERHDTGATTTDGDPVYRKNPHPTQAYRITMTIEDAPGPFEWVSGTAFYEMTNRDACTPFDRSLAMSTKQKEDGIPINFEKAGDTTYVATIYADGMIDADYYGKGVCLFELNGVGISLRATGKKEETRFQPILFKNEIYRSTPKITYFWKERYPKAGMDDFPDGGESKVDDFNDIARNNLFKVTLSTKKVIP
ncbi:hypothetical protein XcuCFBP2542_18720 [Xanthomonas cucurbitae]|uniref:Uncharacterized protein n=2 Tax=Xanthomonas cucurbitae TaxID=56453 RepID=A0A2S7D9S3_9XANT|nr:hypothetical protein [Xanthomonas cucurbitae]PPU70474.1 hypothetical protein XcuCFBP2542_18720 [Xanthomonas cucurbitae]WDM80348.1 hypothetical protein K6980_06635 [Xanthomonas cucurbitae]WDM84038.1 hypothetical protein K6979_06640 [Xanthomonas cucurbitae]